MNKTIEFKRMGNIIQIYIEDDKIMMKSPEYCGEVSTVVGASYWRVHGAYGTIGNPGYSTNVLQATKYIHEIHEACEMLLNGGTIWVIKTNLS